MTELRSYIDPDQHTCTGPTFFMTERNEHEVRCGMCSRTGYVDDETYRVVSDAIESGRDNPFLCEVCEEEYDDLAHEG
jgi:hypothetical protein